MSDTDGNPLNTESTAQLRSGEYCIVHETKRDREKKNNPPSNNNNDGDDDDDDDNDESQEQEERDKGFECAICLEIATEPVVTQCGHLFCWNCIYQWMNSGRSNANACPVCKSLFTQENLIPLYGRGKESNDPRKKVPEQRPTGHRTQPPPQQQQQPPVGNPFAPFGVNGNGTGWSFNAGFGPFGIPMLSFGMGFPRNRTVYRDYSANASNGNNAAENNNANPEEARREQLARILFVILVIAVTILPFISV